MNLSFRVHLVSLAATALGVAAVSLSEGHPRSDPAGARAGAAREIVRFALVDGSSGKPTPAMVCIRSLDDSAVRLPPDGRVLDQVSRTEAFHAGIDYRPDDPGWVGPVRMMAGQGDNDDRSFVYGELRSVPFWQEPVAYQTQPAFSIALEPGRYRLSAARGMEYVPITHDFTVTADASATHTLRLERWVDLPKLGWYSGDVHVHHPTREEAHREFLLRYAEAEDLHVVNVLEMGHHAGTDFPQLGFGREFRVRRGEYLLVSGQEEPRSTFGHIIGLNTTALARDLPTYDFYDLAFDRLRKQGQALVGYAHFSWNGCDLPRGFPWYVTTERIDFIELLQFARINTPDYHAYLNLGFRLTAAAGSDTPWGSTIGEVRTYVHTGGSLDADAWFDGLRRGRTFVSNGPALEFSVAGQLPGAEIRARAGDRLRVRARAWGHERVGRPEILELVSNQGVIEDVRSAAQPAGELTIDHELVVTRSQWLAVRTRCPNGAVAHTTPVYVTVGGEPCWSPTEGPALVKQQLDAIAEIDLEFADQRDERAQGIRVRLERAREYYAKLLQAMTGSKR